MSPTRATLYGLAMALAAFLLALPFILRDYLRDKRGNRRANQ